MSIHVPQPHDHMPVVQQDRAVCSAAIATSGLGNVRLSRFESPKDVEALWKVLEQNAVCSAYQRFDWVNGWLETIGKAANVRPEIVVVSRDGEALALFPLAVRKRGPFRVLGWLGDSHTNFHMPLMTPEFLAKTARSDMLAIMGQLPVLIEGCDTLELCCQPEVWKGHANPMAFVGAEESHNHAYALDLNGGFDAALDRGNGARKRKKYRWQCNKLKPVGGARLLIADTPEACRRILDAAFAQMAVRFTRSGIWNTFDDAGAEAFFRNAALRSLAATEPELRLFALEIEGEIRATFAAGISKGQMSGCFLSIADDEWKSVSPGEMLIYLVIQHCTEIGLTAFDLGRGEERYKTSWCTDTIAMFDSVQPLSRRAIGFAFYERTKLNVKRMVKRNASTWAFAKKVRSRLYGKV